MRSDLKSCAQTQLLSAHNGIMARIKEENPVPGLHADTSRKQHLAQLSTLITGDGLRGMTEWRSYCAVDTFRPFGTAISETSHGFEERCDSN